jgi:uncharacterized membrane protein (DUF485 family)
MEPTRQLPPAIPPLVKKTDLATEAAQAVARRAAETSPLNEEHYREIARALKLRRPVQKATRVAYSSAVTTLVLALLSLLCALYWFSWLGTLISLAFVGSGIVEFVGYRRLLRADESAPRLLAFNQLALCGIIAVYCLVSMLQVHHIDLTPDISPAMRRELAGTGSGGMLDSLDKIVPLLYYAVYIVLLITSLMVQGGMAVYYYTRGTALMTYHQLTAAWITRLLNQVA